MSSAMRKQRPVKNISVCQDFVFPKTASNKRPQKTEDPQKLLKYIDDNIIGKGTLFLGPFGRRKDINESLSPNSRQTILVVYANYSTSGRSLQFLEDYICKEVLPSVGDISCSSSVTGLQSHLYDTESRDIIKHAVNASEHDEIIFCNNPSTRLANLFGEKLNEDRSKSVKVVLFVSNLEPFDNIKAWIDLGVQIEKIDKNHDGFLDLVDLEKRLCQHKENNSILIGMFSTVSRLTGILADDVATTILLHQHGAISIWDYSASCSSAQINVNPELTLAAKDAVFFNCCNMIGGVQAGGILILKKSIIQSYPSIQIELINSINIVRCGLVMQLKETLGTHIMVRSEKICKQVLSHIRNIPEIILLGQISTVTRRIPTVCFIIKHPRGTFLHHRFVVAILNDLFGIQSTATNLIHQALGISDTLKIEYERCINNDSIESICPGYTRLTFPFFMTDVEIGFILEALKMVAQEGWKLLPQYEINSKSGEWRHLSNALAKERKWLHSIRYNDGRMLFNDRRISAPDRLPQNYGDCLQTARNIFSRARKTAQRSNSDDSCFTSTCNDQIEKLRWYILPREAHELLIGPSQNVKNETPFDPKKSLERSLSMTLDLRRFQKSRSLIDSMHLPVKNSPPSTPEKQHSVELSSPPSPIVRFTLGGDTKCAMTSFSQNLTIQNRNRCHSWSSKSPQKNIILNQNLRTKRCLSQCVSSQTELGLSPMELESCSSDTEQDISAYVKEVTREISDEIKSEIREVISMFDEDVPEIVDIGDMKILNSDGVGDKRNETSTSSSSLFTAATNVTREICNVTKETKLVHNHRQINDTSKAFYTDDKGDKQRSDSLPIQAICTGAISKLKINDIHQELSSQDSGINMNFHDDERKKIRKFSDE